MEYKQIILTVSLLIVMYFVVGNTYIELAPFHINVERPWLALGIVLVTAGLMIAIASSDVHGYERGIKHGVEIKTGVIYDRDSGKDSSNN